MKKAWALEISKTNSKVKDDDKFPSLLEFLNEHKRAIEYEENDIRGCSMQGEASHFELSHKSNESKSTKEQCLCVIHNNSSHNTSVCTTFSSMSPQERMKCVWDNKLCYSCLQIGHLSFACKTKTTWETEGCSKYHNSLLHYGMVEGINNHFECESNSLSGGMNTCLLQIMAISTVQVNNNRMKPLIVFFDAGATIRLITFAKAAILNLHGNEVSITITKVSGSKETISSYQYSLSLVDKNGVIVELEVYGIDKISTEVGGMNISGVMHLFKEVKKSEIQRPAGDIDVLVGFEYAGFHPVKEQAVVVVVNVKSIW